MNGKQRMVKQSRWWLYDTLINSMTKESFQDISITEIAQTAELPRRTLYHSFKNKEAVINYLHDQSFDQYFEQLLQQKPQVGEMMLETASDIFLNFWWQKRGLIQLLIRQGLFDHMSEIWQRKVTPRYQQFAVPWHVQGTPTRVNYMMVFQLGGFTDILHVWLDQDNPESPEQIKGVMLLAARQLAGNLNAN